MSFHRVLPLLPALSNEALRDRWATKPDTLLSSKIMPHNDDSTEGAAPRDAELAKPASQSLPPPPPPPDDQGPSSAGEEEEVENYESIRNPARSLSLTPDARSRPSKTVEKSSPDETSDRWQGESPRSICLCQPDPKVPRPRNGTCNTTSIAVCTAISFAFASNASRRYDVFHD